MRTYRPGMMRAADPGLSFVRGLIIFGWTSALLLWPLALFLSQWGDCLGEPCAEPSLVRRVSYPLTGIGLLGAGVVAAVTASRPDPRWFLGLTIIAVIIAGLGVSGLIGAPGLGALALLLPGTVVLALGAYGAARTLSKQSTWWADGTFTGGLGIGLAAYLTAYLLYLAVTLLGMSRS